jgi:flagellar FliJ protein
MIAARQDTSSLEKLREKKLESYEKELQRQEELRIDELVANTRAVEAGLL